MTKQVYRSYTKWECRPFYFIHSCSSMECGLLSNSPRHHCWRHVSHELISIMFWLLCTLTHTHTHTGMSWREYTWRWFSSTSMLLQACTPSTTLTSDRWPKITDWSFPMNMNLWQRRGLKDSRWGKEENPVIELCVPPFLSLSSPLSLMCCYKLKASTWRNALLANLHV